MALKKQLEIRNTGIFAEYWRLYEIEILVGLSQLRFKLIAYASKDSRDGGSGFIENSEKVYYIKNDELVSLFNKVVPSDTTYYEAIATEIYNWVKENDPDFENAEDV